MVTPAESNDQLGITPTYIPLIAVDCLEQQCILLANSACYPGAEYPYFKLSTSRTSLALATAFPRPSGRPLHRCCPHPISVIDSATVGLLTCLPHSHPQSVVFSSILKPASCKANAVATKPVDPISKVRLAPESADLISKVPAPYHAYLDVFSKIKATTLPPQCSYDHKIDWKMVLRPPFSPIYSLSEVEQLEWQVGPQPPTLLPIMRAGWS